MELSQGFSRVTENNPETGHTRDENKGLTPLYEILEHGRRLAK